MSSSGVSSSTTDQTIATYQILSNEGINATDTNLSTFQDSQRQAIIGKNQEVRNQANRYNNLYASVYNSQINIKKADDLNLQNLADKINKNENEIFEMEKKIINKNKLIEINQDSLNKKEIYIHGLQMFFIFLFLLIFPFLAYLSKMISQLTLMACIVLFIVIYIIYLIWYINRKSERKFKKDSKYNKGIYSVKKTLNELDGALSAYASNLLNEDCGCEQPANTTTTSESSGDYVSTTGGLVQRINTNVYYDDGTGPKQQINPIPTAKTGDNFMIDWESGQTGLYDPDPRWEGTGLPRGSLLVDTLTTVANNSNNYIKDIYSFIMKEPLPTYKLEEYKNKYSNIGNSDTTKSNEAKKSYVIALFNSSEFKSKYGSVLNWVKENDKPYVNQNMYKTLTSGL
jgi:ABC-type multidrug transport system fused ATPase/permease subunit